MPLNLDRTRPDQPEAVPVNQDRHSNLIKHWSNEDNMRDLYANYVKYNILNDKVVSFNDFKARTLGSLEVEHVEDATKKGLGLPETLFERDGTIDHINQRTGKVETLPKFRLKPGNN